MKKLHFPILVAAACIISCGFGAKNVLAYMVEDLNFEVRGDIVLGPGKTELWMDKGDSYTKELLISNRTGHKKIFRVKVEDFRGSRDPGETIQFLGDEKSPYSLKDYVHPEITEIILSHGQRLRLPVEISIPENAEPGGLYGAVLISASNIEEEMEEVENAAGKMKIITQLASLFFVRVKGDVLENGFMKDFRSLSNFYEKAPVSFSILYENNGSVHMSPYGVVEIKNMLGKKIDELQVDPWFVMPDSVRAREVKWDKGGLFGRYTAIISINRGYQDIIDTKSYTFWVVPWKIILIGFIAFVLIMWFFIWIISHFEIRKKAPDLPPPSQ